MRVEAAARDRDRERVLVLLAARLDALVTEDALRVVAHVQVVVELRRLRDGCASGAEPLGVRVVALDVGEASGAVERSTDEPRSSITSRRLVRTRARVGQDRHSRLDLARACRDECPRALELDDADAADVHRVERVAVAERRHVDPGLRQASRIVEPSVTLTERPSIVELRRHGAMLAGTPMGEGDGVTAVPRASRVLGRRSIADATAFAARLAETADRRISHDLRQVVEHLELVPVRIGRSPAGAAPLPGGRSRHGTGRTGRTTRRERTRRCGGRRRRGPRSRRTRSRRPSRASRPPRACPRT